MVLLAPVIVLATALLLLRPVLEAEAAELPSWQLALLLSSDAAVVFSYVVWVAGALLRGPPRAEVVREPNEQRVRLAVPLLSLIVMFAPDVVVSSWLTAEHAAARTRAVETSGTVVRIEDGAPGIRLARYVFVDRAGVQRYGSLRFPKLQRTKNIDLELLAALQGPVPFEVRLRYDPLHLEHSWLLGQQQALNSLPEMSVLVLVVQMAFVGIVAFTSRRGEASGEAPVLRPEERVKVAPILVLAGIYMLMASR